MRDPKHPRQFTEEFRRQIVALVDSGKPRAEVMRECDLGKSTLDRWIRRVHACGSTAVLTSIYFLPHSPIYLCQMRQWRCAMHANAFSPALVNPSSCYPPAGP